MHAFKFRLARVLSWYRKQGQLAEDRLRTSIADLAGAEAAIVRLRESRTAVEKEIVNANSVQATDLAALQGYREWSRREELALHETLATIKARVEEHRKHLKVLRTRIRLLEKLGERRLAEHIITEERELEELAADAFRATSFHSRDESP